MALLPIQHLSTHSAYFYYQVVTDLRFVHTSTRNVMPIPAARLYKIFTKVSRIYKDLQGGIPVLRAIGTYPIYIKELSFQLAKRIR